LLCGWVSKVSFFAVFHFDTVIVVEVREWSRSILRTAIYALVVFTDHAVAIPAVGFEIPAICMVQTGDSRKAKLALLGEGISPGP